MNEVDRKMFSVDEPDFKDAGARFLLFQKAIRKDDAQLAADLNVFEHTIRQFSAGKIAPGILHLHLLHEKYGLSIHWLLTGDGHMFTRQTTQNRENDEEDSQQDSIQNREKQLDELVDLMQVPAVGQAIDAALTEILALLELKKIKKTTK